MQVCHWGAGRTQRKDKLKEISHETSRVGMSMAFAVFVDTALGGCY